MGIMDFQKAYDAFAASTKVEFVGGRETTIGASEIGACARQVGYKKSGAAVDAGYVDGTGYAMRGNVMEDHSLVPIVRNVVEAVGGELLWAGQNDQMRLVNEKKWVSATPDGLSIKMPRDFLAKNGVPDIGSDEIYWELKSIDPRFNMEKLPKPEHVDQTNLGMGLVRRASFEVCTPVKGKPDKVETVKYAPNYAVILYQDCSDYSILRPFVVKYDDEGFKGQLVRAKNIMTAAGWVWDEENDAPAWQDENGNFLGVPDGRILKAVEQLRPEGKITSNGKACQYCAYSKRCLGYSATVPKSVRELKPNVLQTVRKLAHMVNEIGQKISALKEEESSKKAELKEVLSAAGSKFVDAGDIKINWKSSDGQDRADMDALKAFVLEKGREWSDFVKRTKPSESLSVEYVNALANATK